MFEFLRRCCRRGDGNGNPRPGNGVMSDMREASERHERAAKELRRVLAMTPEQQIEGVVRVFDPPERLRK